MSGRILSQHQPTGCWIRKEKRLAVYLRDEFRCAYCGHELHHQDPADVTLDHVVPLARGGTNEASNLVCACRSCNSARQDKPVREYAPYSVAWIRRVTRRSLKRHLDLAKELIAEGRSMVNIELA